MRGMDQSVSKPTRAELVLARASLQVDDTVQLVKLEIPRPGHDLDYFITPTPIATPHTPPGRATRVFHAYDVAHRRKVLLKDSWRVDLPEIQPEGLTYKTLMNASVPHIPHCISSGDITTDKYHATMTKHYATNKFPWAYYYDDGHFIPHRHYRLVLDVIGLSLTKFKSSHQMVTAVRDALIGEFKTSCKEDGTDQPLAHKEAYYNAQILHRDFSVGNIIIHDGRGLLIDWDLSRPVSSKWDSPRCAIRTVHHIFVALHDYSDVQFIRARGNSCHPN